MGKLHLYNCLWLFVGMITVMPTSLFAGRKMDVHSVIQKVYDYPKSVSPIAGDSIVSNTYIKYDIDTRQRNVLMWLIPNMYPYARGDRKVVGESYNRTTYHFRNSDEIDFDIEPYAAIKTNRHGSTRGVKAVLMYISPFIYNECMIGEHLLSPFNRANRRYYKYEISQSDHHITTIHFRPRHTNTQLVRGLAEIDSRTGQVLICEIYFEYDMMFMTMTIEQGRDGIRSLLPEMCCIKSRFNIIGNKQKCVYMAYYNQMQDFTEDGDSIDERSEIAHYRPIDLSPWEEKIYEEYDERQKMADSTVQTDEKSRFREWLDDLGENMVKTQRVETGKTEISISPIANIFGIDYSHRRGLSYKMDANLNYNTSPNRSLELSANLGFNFKIPQFFYSIPVCFNYDKRNNGRLTFEIANGNRITNNTIIEDIKEHGFKPEVSEQDLFNNFYMQISNTNRLTRHLNMTVGTNYYRRVAVDKDFYKKFNMPFRFYTFAPHIQFDYRFWDRGPLLSLNYEQGIEALGCDIRYSRVEADWNWKKSLNKLRILSLRLGTGAFFDRSQNYFVEYKNFRDNNLPERWHDDWTGNFQLLNSQYYNISKYYVRANTTYESPMMILYRLPLIGRYIETERVYFNVLTVEDLHPYMEIGYGFTNRFFSCAVYTNMLKGKFDEIGFNFTLELFDEW